MGGKWSDSWFRLHQGTAILNANSAGPRFKSKNLCWVAHFERDCQSRVARNFLSICRNFWKCVFFFFFIFPFRAAFLPGPPAEATRCTGGAGFYMCTKKSIKAMSLQVRGDKSGRGNAVRRTAARACGEAMEISFPPIFSGWLGPTSNEW